MLAAVDLGTLTTFTGPVVVLAGVVFAALRYNREETGKTVEQQTQVLGNMKDVYEALERSLKRAESEREEAQEERDKARAERDAQRVEANALREEVAAARQEVGAARGEIATLRSELAAYERRRDGER